MNCNCVFFFGENLFFYYFYGEDIEKFDDYYDDILNFVVSGENILIKKNFIIDNVNDLVFRCCWFRRSV